jgi:uncharacterized membrane protein YqjE
MTGTEARPLEDATIATLVQEAVASARELADAELRSLFEELTEEQARAKRLAAMGGGAAVVGIAGLSWLGMGLLVLAHASALAMVLTAAVAICVAAGLAFGAYRVLPEITFQKTRARLAQRAERLVAAAKGEPAPPGRLVKEGAES